MKPNLTKTDQKHKEWIILYKAYNRSYSINKTSDFFEHRTNDRMDKDTISKSEWMNDFLV